MSNTDLSRLPSSIRPLATVAAALGELRESVVFIGGAVAPLLQSHPPFPKVRATKDVDAISAVATYTAAGDFEVAISKLGFRRDPTYRGHAHRWISPGDIPFDLVPAGSFLGGSGNNWDQLAIASAEKAALADDLTIRHVSAPLFLVLKWAAYRDRGHGKPLVSTDLEDFIGLLASRPMLMGEIETLPPAARDYLRAAARGILRHPDCDDVLEAHLYNATPRAAVVERVRSVLRETAV